MILDAILGWLAAFGNWLAGLLPTGHLSMPDLGLAVSFLDDLNYFLPIHELFTAVVAVIALGPAFFLATLTAWVAVGVVRGGNPRA